MTGNRGPAALSPSNCSQAQTWKFSFLNSAASFLVLLIWPSRRRGGQVSYPTRKNSFSHISCCTPRVTGRGSENEDGLSSLLRRRRHTANQIHDLQERANTQREKHRYRHS